MIFYLNEIESRTYFDERKKKSFRKMNEMGLFIYSVRTH
jgi:hypothetical protein